MSNFLSCPNMKPRCLFFLAEAENSLKLKSQPSFKTSLIVIQTIQILDYHTSLNHQFGQGSSLLISQHIYWLHETEVDPNLGKQKPNILQSSAWKIQHGQSNWSQLANQHKQCGCIFQNSSKVSLSPLARRYQVQFLFFLQMTPFNNFLTKSHSKREKGICEKSIKRFSAYNFIVYQYASQRTKNQPLIIFTCR